MVNTSSCSFAFPRRIGSLPHPLVLCHPPTASCSTMYLSASGQCRMQPTAPCYLSVLCAYYGQISIFNPLLPPCLSLPWSSACPSCLHSGVKPSDENVIADPSDGIYQCDRYFAIRHGPVFSHYTRPDSSRYGNNLRPAFSGLNNSMTVSSSTNVSRVHSIYSPRVHLMPLHRQHLHSSTPTLQSWC